MLDANETMMVPVTKPNTAPATSVNSVAPGNDKAMAAM